MTEKTGSLLPSHLLKTPDQFSKFEHWLLAGTSLGVAGVQKINRKLLAVAEALEHLSLSDVRS